MRVEQLVYVDGYGYEQYRNDPLGCSFAEASVPQWVLDAADRNSRPNLYTDSFLERPAKGHSKGHPLYVPISRRRRIR